MKKNILVCNFELEKNIYRNRIINNNLIFDIDKNYDNINLEINFYLNKRDLNDDDYIEIDYYKILSDITIKHYSK